MSVFRSRFSTDQYVVEASTPSFKLVCNVYNQMPASFSAARSAAPPIIFAHANGFHKEIWEPIISRISLRWTANDLYAFDCRNQGDSAVLNKDVLEKTFDWYSYAYDILQIIDKFNLKKPVGIGHSFGASAIILAELIRPGTFSAIVTIDPSMFPRSVDPSIFPRSIYLNAPVDDHPMAQLTLKRRDTWKDRIEAKENLLEKRFFRSWHPEVLDLYVEHGMIDVINEDGSSSLILKCPKYQEAITFTCMGTGLYDSFERLNELEIPVQIITGKISDMNPEELAAMKLDQCKFGSLETIKDTGHLLSLEKPQETADIISTFLDRVLAASKSNVEQTKARL